MLAPYDQHEQVGPVFGPPSTEHWLGLDDGGVDMLSLMIWGARVSLIVGFAAALVAMLIGGAVGILAGYFGGRTDIVLMRFTDYVLVIPDIPLMLIVAAVWGRSLTNIILIIGVIYWTSTARLIRAQVKSVRERVYVKRARALGAGHNRLVFRHVLPQVMPLLVANTVLMVAVAIFAETAIAFLGLGDPSLTSWGLLIENAFDGRRSRPAPGGRSCRPARRDGGDPGLHDARHRHRGRPEPAAAGRATCRSSASGCARCRRRTRP